MRRAAQLLLVTGALAALAPSAYGLGSVILAWDASSDPAVTGYNVYYGCQSRAYTNLIPAGTATSALLTNLAPGTTYYFAATAVNNVGLESDYSTEVAYAVPADGPNQPPTIDPVGNLTFLENSGPHTISLTGISSGLTNQVPLTVTAVSSDTTLVPTLTVSYNSPDVTGALNLEAASNAVGTATITVTVDNGQPTNHLAISSFLVNIVPTNSVTASAWTLWWQHSDGYIAAWQMDQTNRLAASRIGSGPVATDWVLAGTGDFQGNGSSDLLWHHKAGWVSLWLMDGTNCTSHVRLNDSPVGTHWRIAGTGDFDGNGSPDIIWQHSSGWVALWLMDHTNVLSSVRLNTPPVSSAWRIVGSGHFDGTTNASILWQSTAGSLAVWVMNGTNRTAQFPLNAPHVDSRWKVVGTTDILGNGNTDILWQNTGGQVAYWLMNGTNFSSSSYFSPQNTDPSWRVAGPQ